MKKIITTIILLIPFVFFFTYLPVSLSFGYDMSEWDSIAWRNFWTIGFSIAFILFIYLGGFRATTIQKIEERVTLEKREQDIAHLIKQRDELVESLVHILNWHFMHEPVSFLEEQDIENARELINKIKNEKV